MKTFVDLSSSGKKNDTEFGVMMMTVEISTNEEIFNLFTLITTCIVRKKF